VAAVGIIAAAAGFLAGWIVSPGRETFIYEVRKPMHLTGARGEPLGMLPIGTEVLSPLRMRNDPDIGWWCLVPVSMGTMDEAMPAVMFKRSHRALSYIQKMLNARVGGSPAPDGIIESKANAVNSRK
jgi:hypothetical protein